MKRIIKNMMKWFNIDEQYLKNEQTVKTPIGQNLYWDYYCYVKEQVYYMVQKMTYVKKILYSIL